MKHTPGPWKEIDGVIWNVDDDGMPGTQAIADVRVLDSLQRRKGEDLIQANARLIAAAPDMAQALAMLWPVANDTKNFLQEIIRYQYDVDAEKARDFINALTVAVQAARIALKNGGVDE